MIYNTKILARLSAVSPLGNSLEARRVLRVLQEQISTPQLLAALNVVKLCTEATVIIGYKGYIELARRSGKVTTVKAEQLEVK